MSELSLGGISAVVLALFKQARDGSLPLVLTKKEAARQLGVKVTTLNRYVAAGWIRVFRYEENGHPKILSSEVARFVAQKAEESGISVPKPRPGRRLPAAKLSVSDELAKLEEISRARKRRRS